MLTPTFPQTLWVYSNLAYSYKLQPLLLHAYEQPNALPPPLIVVVNMFSKCTFIVEKVLEVAVIYGRGSYSRS
jgi:hypothetical protein